MSFSTSYSLNCDKHSILDIDADEYGNYIALLSNAEVWTNNWQLALKHQFEYPLIRELNNEQFLVVEARRMKADNGHIFDTAGQLLVSFNAGDGVEDVLIQAGRIVISYFDEGVFGSGKPSSDGLAVFDFAGQQLFGFNSSQPYFIVDCYCMCRKGQDSILAYTYTDFPLLEIRLTDYRVIQQPTPSDFEGAHAVTTIRGQVIFYSSYAHKESFFWWDGQERVRRFPYQETSMRGIADGKFLTFNSASFTILDAEQMMDEIH